MINIKRILPPQKIRNLKVAGESSLIIEVLGYEENISGVSHYDKLKSRIRSKFTFDLTKYTNATKYN